MSSGSQKQLRGQAGAPATETDRLLDCNSRQLAALFQVYVDEHPADGARIRVPPSLPGSRVEVRGQDRTAGPRLQFADSHEMKQSEPSGQTQKGKSSAAAPSGLQFGLVPFSSSGNGGSDKLGGAERAASKLYRLRSSNRHKHRRRSQPDPKEVRAALSRSKRSGFHAYKGQQGIGGGQGGVRGRTSQRGAPAVAASRAMLRSGLGAATSAAIEGSTAGMDAATQERGGASLPDRGPAAHGRGSEHGFATDRHTPNLGEQHVTPRSDSGSRSPPVRENILRGVTDHHSQGRIGGIPRRGSSPLAEARSSGGGSGPAGGRPRGDTGTGTSATSGTMTSPRSDGGRSRSSTALDRVRKQSIDMQRDAGERMSAIRSTVQVKAASKLQLSPGVQGIMSPGSSGGGVVTNVHGSPPRVGAGGPPRRRAGRRHSVASTASSASQPSPLKRSVRVQAASPSQQQEGRQSAGSSDGRGRKGSTGKPGVPRLDLTLTLHPGSGLRGSSPGNKFRKGSDDSVPLPGHRSSPGRGVLGIADGRRQSGGSIGTSGSGGLGLVGRRPIASPNSTGSGRHRGSSGNITPLSPASADGAARRRLSGQQQQTDGRAVGAGVGVGFGFGTAPTGSDPRRTDSGSSSPYGSMEPSPSSTPGHTPPPQARRLQPGASRGQPSRLRQVVDVSQEQDKKQTGGRSDGAGSRSLDGEGSRGRGGSDSSASTRGRSSRRRLHGRMARGQVYGGPAQPSPHDPSKTTPAAPTAGIGAHMGRPHHLLSGGATAREEAHSKSIAGRQDAQEQAGLRRHIGQLPTIHSAANLAALDKGALEGSSGDRGSGAHSASSGASASSGSRGRGAIAVGGSRRRVVGNAGMRGASLTPPRAVEGGDSGGRQGRQRGRLGIPVHGSGSQGSGHVDGSGSRREEMHSASPGRGSPTGSIDHDDMSLPSASRSGYLPMHMDLDDDPERSAGSARDSGDDRDVQFADHPRGGDVGISPRDRAKSQPHRDAAKRALANVNSSKSGGQKRSHAYSIAVTGQSGARPGDRGAGGMADRVQRSSGGVGAPNPPEIRHSSSAGLQDSHVGERVGLDGPVEHYGGEGGIRPQLGAYNPLLGRIASEAAQQQADEGDMPGRVIQEVQFQRRMDALQLQGVAQQARSVISGRGSVVDDPFFDSAGSIVAGSVFDDAVPAEERVFGDLKQPEVPHDAQQPEAGSLGGGPVGRSADGSKATGEAGGQMVGKEAASSRQQQSSWGGDAAGGRQKKIDQGSSGWGGQGLTVVAPDRSIRDDPSTPGQLPAIVEGDHHGDGGAGEGALGGNQADKCKKRERGSVSQGGAQDLEGGEGVDQLGPEWHAVPDHILRAGIPRRRAHSGGGRPGTGSGSRPLMPKSPGQARRLLAGASAGSDGSHASAEGRGSATGSASSSQGRPVHGAAASLDAGLVTRPRTNSSPVLPPALPPRIPGAPGSGSGRQATPPELATGIDSSSFGSGSVPDHPSIANASRHSIATSEASSAAARRSKREKGISDPSAAMGMHYTDAAAGRGGLGEQEGTEVHVQPMHGRRAVVDGARAKLPAGVGANKLGAGGLSSAKHVKVPMVLRQATAGDPNAVRALTEGARSLLGDDDRAALGIEALVGLAPSVAPMDDERPASGQGSNSGRGSKAWRPELDHLDGAGALSQRSDTASPAAMASQNLDSSSEAGGPSTRGEAAGSPAPLTQEEQRALAATAAAAGWSQSKSKSLGRGKLSAEAGDQSPGSPSVKAAKRARRSLAPVRQPGAASVDRRDNPPASAPQSPSRSRHSGRPGGRSPSLYVLAEEGMPDAALAEEMPFNQPGSMAMSVQSAYTSASAVLERGKVKNSELPRVGPPPTGNGSGSGIGGAASKDPSLVAGLLSGKSMGGVPARRVPGRFSLGGGRQGMRRRFASDAQSMGRPSSPSSAGFRSGLHPAGRQRDPFAGGFVVGGRVGGRVGTGFVSGAASVSGRSVGSRRSVHSIKSEIPAMMNRKTGAYMPLAVARARKESIDEAAVPLETTFGAMTRVVGSRRAGSVSGARSAIGGPPAGASNGSYTARSGRQWQQGSSPTNASGWPQPPHRQDDAVSVSKSTYTALGDRRGRVRSSAHKLAKIHSPGHTPGSNRPAGIGAGIHARKGSHPGELLGEGQSPGAWVQHHSPTDSGGGGEAAADRNFGQEAGQPQVGQARRPLQAQPGQEAERQELMRGLADAGSHAHSPMFAGDSSVMQDSPRRLVVDESRVASPAGRGLQRVASSPSPSAAVPSGVRGQRHSYGGAAEGDVDEGEDGPPPDGVFQAGLLFSAQSRKGSAVDPLQPQEHSTRRELHQSHSDGHIPVGSGPAGLQQGGGTGVEAPVMARGASDVAGGAGRGGFGVVQTHLHNGWPGPNQQAGTGGSPDGERGPLPDPLYTGAQASGGPMESPLSELDVDAGYFGELNDARGQTPSPMRVSKLWEETGSVHGKDRAGGSEEDEDEVTPSTGRLQGVSKGPKAVGVAVSKGEEPAAIGSGGAVHSSSPSDGTGAPPPPSDNVVRPQPIAPAVPRVPRADKPKVSGLRVKANPGVALEGSLPPPTPADSGTPFSRRSISDAVRGGGSGHAASGREGFSSQELTPVHSARPSSSDPATEAAGDDACSPAPSPVQKHRDCAPPAGRQGQLTRIQSAATTGGRNYGPSLPGGASGIALRSRDRVERSVSHDVPSAVAPGPGAGGLVGELRAAMAAAGDGGAEVAVLGATRRGRGGSGGDWRRHGGSAGAAHRMTSRGVLRLLRDFGVVPALVNRHGVESVLRGLRRSRCGVVDRVAGDIFADGDRWIDLELFQVVFGAIVEEARVAPAEVFAVMNRSRRLASLSKRSHVAKGLKAFVAF